MRQKIKDIFRSQITQVPLVSTWWINWQFKVERELLEGCHQAKSCHPSIIHFSMNKAATQYIKRILRCCALENRMVHAKLNEYAFCSNFPYLDRLSLQEMQQYQQIFKPHGYLYSVFGSMIEGIPNLDDYYVVLMIRDPRDILTSSYFSIANSHPLPKGENKIEFFTKKRSFARNAEIDQYVIAFSDHVQQVYQRYLDLLVNKTNVHITKYEDMIANFPVWLDNLLDYCDLKISYQLKQELLDEAYQSRLTKENVSNHMRQVTPEDYKRKLQPETIDQLNSSLSSILAEFKYT